MSERSLRLRFVAVLLPLCFATAMLSGCGEKISSPVGAWEATGDDHGVLILAATGEFEVLDLSFNLLQDRDADNDFFGVGRWRLSADEKEVILLFDRASQGDFIANTDVAVEVDFTSGSMYFVDVEDTAHIELRLSERDD